MLAVDQKPEFLPGLPVAPPRLPLVQPTPNVQQAVPRITRGKDPERFYCPYQGCNRSFAELWRLKVHYRAPPDVRGSGKERGHGCELQYCPKCGKELRAGKHHVGCFAGRTGPRQPQAKRFKGFMGQGPQGDDERISDDEVEGQPRGPPGGPLRAVEEGSEGSEASHPRDMDRKRNIAAMYGREESPEHSQGRLVHGIQHPRLSPSSHRMIGGGGAVPSDGMFMLPGDFIPHPRHSPNHSGERSVSGVAGRSPLPRVPSPPPLPPGDDGRPVHYLFDFDLFNPADTRPKVRDDGTRPVHTVLSNASSGEAGGAFPAPMSDDYIMQIMFGAADVNSIPKRVTSHLHHWDEDVGNVEGFGMMAGNNAAEADVAANPSNMRGALDTLVNYGADQVPDPETVFLHRIVPLRHYAQPMSQRMVGFNGRANGYWHPGGCFNMNPGQAEPMIGLSVSDGGKASSLGTRDGDAMQQTRLGSPHAPTSMPGGSVPAFISAQGQMYQQAAPMHMYPHVNANPHPAVWSNAAVGQRAQA